MIRIEAAAAAVLNRVGNGVCMAELMHTPACESIPALRMGHCNDAVVWIEIFLGGCLDGFQ